MNNLNPSEKVYRKIEEKIINREWLPGMKIKSENQLAKELKVSRVSVREAMEKLVALDVLTKKQGGGTFVNELSPSMYLNGLLPMILINKDNLLDIQEFRLILEVDNARLCTERCSEEDIIELENYYIEMKENTNNPEAFISADWAFHMQIAKGTQNSLLIKVNKIMTDLLMYHQTELNTALGPNEGLLGHERILNAIRERDPELAALQMRRHIERTMNDIKKS